MCLPAVALAATAASAVIGAASSMQQGSAQQAAYDYRAQVARNNAILDSRAADAATQAGEAKAAQANLVTGQRIGAVRANAAASGVDPNSGSAADIQGDVAQTGALDALTIRNNAARQALGYKVEGMSDTADAALDTQAGNDAVTAGYLGAGKSILGGVSGVSDKWASFGQTGIKVLG